MSAQDDTRARLAAGGMKLVDHWSPHVPEKDAEVYRMLHRAHCDMAKDPAVGDDHKCRGTISINHNRITLRCPLCGNVKAPL